MIESIGFRNYKVLRETTLPLGRFVLLVGPNGSGKSTAIDALRKVANPGSFTYQSLVTAGQEPTQLVEVVMKWGAPFPGDIIRTRWSSTQGTTRQCTRSDGARLSDDRINVLFEMLQAMRIYSLDATAIATPVTLQPQMELASNGSNLAGVLDLLRDRHPERFEELNRDLGGWVPEFDRVLFDTPAPGQRALSLRTRHGHHAIPAKDLSQGTLFALTISTLAYIRNPAPMVCFEEPDRGLHPRLLRDVQDALYRLSYPDKFGDKREPAQVVATTHSPYFLDLFKEHPEEVVIAHKVGQEARFESLAARTDLQEMLGNATLGEIWYSGILGGVPQE